MLSKIFLLLIVQIFFSSDKTQIPEIYDFYVYTKTFYDPIDGPSKCYCDPKQTISLKLKKDFSFILRDNYTTEWSSSTKEKTGNWYLTSSNMLQLNIRSTEKTFYFKGYDFDLSGNRNKPTKKHFDSPDTLKLEFSQYVIIYDYDKKLIAGGKLIKFNKKRMKKIYGDK